MAEKLLQTRVNGDVWQRLARAAKDRRLSTSAYLRRLVEDDVFRNSARVTFELMPELRGQLATRATRDGFKSVHDWTRVRVTRELQQTGVAAWSATTTTNPLRPGTRKPDYRLRWLRDISIDERVFELRRGDGSAYDPDGLAADSTFVEGKPLLVHGSRRQFRHETMVVEGVVEIALSAL